MKNNNTEKQDTTKQEKIKKEKKTQAEILSMAVQECSDKGSVSDGILTFENLQEDRGWLFYSLAIGIKLFLRFIIESVESSENDKKEDHKEIIFPKIQYKPSDKLGFSYVWMSFCNKDGKEIKDPLGGIFPDMIKEEFINRDFIEENREYDISKIKPLKETLIRLV